MSRQLLPDDHPILRRLTPQDVETLARRDPTWEPANDNAAPLEARFSFTHRLIGVAALSILIAIIGAFA